MARRPRKKKDMAETQDPNASQNPEGAGESGVPDGLEIRHAPVPGENTGPTAAEAVASVEGHKTGQRPGVTRAEGEEPGKESHTAPGDAPADTLDPLERLSTASPSGSEMAQAAKDGLGSVVAYAKVGETAAAPSPEDARYEEYEVTVDQFGKTQKVRRNMDTGESVLA